MFLVHWHGWKFYEFRKSSREKRNETNGRSNTIPGMCQRTKYQLKIPKRPNSICLHWLGSNMKLLQPLTSIDKTGLLGTYVVIYCEGKCVFQVLLQTTRQVTSEPIFASDVNSRSSFTFGKTVLEIRSLDGKILVLV